MTRMNWIAFFSAVGLLSVSACSRTGPEPTDVAPAGPPAMEAEASQAEGLSSRAAAEETAAAAAEEPVAPVDTPAESAGPETGATETAAKTEGGRVLGAIGKALKKSVAAGAEDTPNSAPPFGP